MYVDEKRNTLIKKRGEMLMTWDSNMDLLKNNIYRYNEILNEKRI